MKILFILLMFTQVVFAQSTRPNTPYWKLVEDVERAGFTAYAKYDWTDRSLQKLLRDVPVLSNLASQVNRRQIQFKMGGENPGKNGFTTVLKNGDIYVQVYYAKHLKVIDVVLTLGHELVHAMHIDSGLHEDWKKDARTNHKRYSECVSEAGAYTWSGIYSVNESTRKWNAEKIAEYQACMKALAK